jgi:hypothetical protein
MSKEKPFERKIPALYKKSAVDLLMFAYVCGFRRGRPGDNYKNMIECFLEDFELDEDDYSIECAIRTYQRLRKDYFKLLKNG